MNKLRIIAGPNGSGKTSVYKELKRRQIIKFGVLVNADDIERILKDGGILSFLQYKIKVTDRALKVSFDEFVRTRKTVVKPEQIEVRDNFLVVRDKEKVDSYFAAFLSEFIRDEMLRIGVERITIETVMSHPSKLELMKRALSLGYRVYLYYITTGDPMINVDRVKARKDKGGHDVPEDKIIRRYKGSLDLLYDAVNLSNRAFLIDNSGKTHNLIAEFNRSDNVLMLYSDPCPAWVKNYYLDKNV